MRNKKLLITLLILALIAGTLCLYKVTSHLLIPQRPTLEPRLTEVLSDPASRGMTLEPLAIRTPDGLQLSAMIASPIRPTGSAERGHRHRQLFADPLPWGEIRGTIFIVHGRGGRMEFLLPVAERFVAAGFDCVLYTARAHGDSEGHFVTYGANEVRDLREVIQTATESGRVRPPYALWGLSLGASVSLQALPELDEIEAAVLVAPFSDLSTEADHMVRREIPAPWNRLAPVAIPMTNVLVRARAGFSVYDIRPIERAPFVTRPTMVVHGALDRVIPIEQGQAIYHQLSGPKLWREVPDGYHGNVLARGGDALYAEMTDFYVNSLKKRVPEGPNGHPITISTLNRPRSAENSVYE